MTTKTIQKLAAEAAAVRTAPVAFARETAGNFADTAVEAVANLHVRLANIEETAGVETQTIRELLQAMTNVTVAFDNVADRLEKLEALAGLMNGAEDEDELDRAAEGAD